MYCAWNVLTGDMGYCHHARPKGSTDITAEQTEPTVSKMEQVATDTNVGHKDEPKTQMKTQNSNLTFEKRTMRDCYNCKRYETEGECIECHYEPKDEPQTEVCDDCIWHVCNYNKAFAEPQTCSVNGRPYDCGKCEYFRCTADEPQTEVVMPYERMRGLYTGYRKTEQTERRK